MAPEVGMALPPPIRLGLIQMARRFDEADVAYLVGGSAMLNLRGIEVPVGDIDLVVAASQRRSVECALRDYPMEIPPQRDPWRTDWLIRASVETVAGVARIDVMGGLALIIDGSLARFPLVADLQVDFHGIEIPLANLGHWYHLYRAYNPDKAALIRPHLDTATIEQAARALSIAQ